MNEGAIRDYLSAVHSKRQRFGTYDCVRFVIELLYVGFDRDYRDQCGYWDRRSACVRLRRAGGLRQAATDAFGAELAGDELIAGDVAFYTGPATLGLLLPACVVVYGNSRVYRLDRSTVLTGWRS